MFARKLAKEYTVDEYFRLEARSHLKHEFHDGIVYAMVGGSFRHSGLSVKITSALEQFLSDSECRVVGSDARLEIHVSKEQTTHFLYPDCAVTCDHRDSIGIQNMRFPKVIAEVLSPSTEQHDRTTKFELYKNVPTLEDYILISQNEVRIDVIHKMQDHPMSWLTTTSLENGHFEIKSLNFECPVDRIYRDWR